MATRQSTNLSLRCPSPTQRHSLRSVCPPSSADLSNRNFQRLSAGFSSCSAHSSSADFFQARSNPEANIPPPLPTPFHTAFRVAGLHVSAPFSVRKMLSNPVFFGGAPGGRRRPAKCEAGTAVVREQMRHSNPAATVCRATASSCETRRVSVRGSSSHAAAESHNFVEVKNIFYRPTGVQTPLLTDVNLSLPNHSLGLVFGKSGSGKTTLMQVLAGMATSTSGQVYMGEVSSDGGSRQPLTRSQLAEQSGIVFQFPERYFLGDSVLEELTFGWPRRPEDLFVRQALATRLQLALLSSGLSSVSLQADPRTLSGGNQRRLALAVQLVPPPPHPTCLTRSYR